MPEKFSYSAFVALVVSVFSLFVSAISLMKDSENKELMIRPSMSFNQSTDEFSISLANDGLGPAIIKRFAFRRGNSCSPADLRSNKTDSQEKFYDDLKSSLFAEVKKAMPPSFDEQIFTEGGQDMVLFTRDWRVPHGKEEKLVQYSIDEDLDEKYRAMLSGKRLSDLVSENFEKITNNDYVLEAEYCSMTGNFCEVISSGADVRCLNKGR